MKPQPAKKGRWTEWCHKGVLVTDQNAAWEPFATGFPLALSTPGLGWLCPYAQPGDRLWVREAFAHIYRSNTLPATRRAEDVVYMADGFTPDAYAYGSWKPSIHMPRWASRITLEITDVRVERLQDISETDALAEGIVQLRDGGYGLADTTHYHFTDPRNSYWSLWESINGTGSVEANPWVWAVSFKQVQAGKEATP